MSRYRHYIPPSAKIQLPKRIIGASRVVLEPDLQAMARDWSPEKCREMAEELKRWAHQLAMKAVLDAYDNTPRRILERSRPPRRRVQGT